MLSALIAVAVLGANQQAEPLFPRLFPRPTGQNALEYYVRAGDTARAERLDLWSQYLADYKGIPNRLDYEEDMARKTAKILDLVRVGNQYPLTIPEGSDSMTWFSSIKQVSKLALQFARVQFLRGRPDQATDALLLVTEMTDHLYGSGGISQLYVGVAMDSISQLGFHNAYTSISLNGANDILERVIVHDANITVGHWNREIEMIDQGIKKLDPQFDIQAWQAQRTKAILATSKLNEIFLTEEIYWMEMATKLTIDEVKKESLTSSTPPAIVQPDYSLPDAFMAQQFVRSVVANRTKRRLLRLHAHVAKFRWENGTLPPSLEFLTEKEKIDPANGQPFVYQKFSEAAYDIYSQGDQFWGAIRLRTSRSSMIRGNPGPP